MTIPVTFMHLSPIKRKINLNSSSFYQPYGLAYHQAHNKCLVKTCVNDTGYGEVNHPFTLRNHLDILETIVCDSGFSQGTHIHPQSFNHSLTTHTFLFINQTTVSSWTSIYNCILVISTCVLPKYLKLNTFQSNGAPHPGQNNFLLS